MGSGYTGTPTCKSDCKGFETPGGCKKADTSKCGNGALDNDEPCDGTKFKDNKSTCSQYDSKYVSGNLSCSTVITSACAECEAGSAKCDGSTLKTCENKTWKSQPCTGSTPKCDESLKKCVPATSEASYSTDFEWLPDTNSEQYGIDYPMPNTTDYSLSVTGRLNLTNGTADYSISGKGILISLPKNSASGVFVTKLKNGIGTVTFDTKGWDDASVYLEVGNNKTDPQDSAKNTKKTLSFTVNNPSADKFTIRSDGRVAIDNLQWTSAK